MKRFKDGIAEEVLREIFPKKLSRSAFSDEVYTRLRKMILSGKLKKGQKLTYEGMAFDLNVTTSTATKVISRLKKDRLIISKRGRGSFVV